MTRDIVAANIDTYMGGQAREYWAADPGFYAPELAIIRAQFPAAPATVLDIGCGAGRTTIGLEACGYAVEAIDLSADLVDEARKRVARTRVQCMDARELAFPDACFDAVLFSFNGLDSIYPNRERVRVLAEVRRVLRPDGVYVYSGHNGIAQWGPRAHEPLGKMFARNRRMARAQLATFGERSRYLAYPEPNGTQILYAAPPHVHLRDLRAAGLIPLAVYGSRSYRKDPGLMPASIVDGVGWSTVTQLARITLLCPHVHYAARAPA